MSPVSVAQPMSESEGIDSTPRSRHERRRIRQGDAMEDWHHSRRGEGSFLVGVLARSQARPLWEASEFSSWDLCGV